MESHFDNINQSLADIQKELLLLREFAKKPEQITALDDSVLKLTRFQTNELFGLRKVFEG